MKFIKEVTHVPKRPVTIEREVNDKIVIEGVPYAADLFRYVAMPDDEVLVAIRKNADGVVELTEIRNLADAKKFFEEVHRAL